MALLARRPTERRTGGESEALSQSPPASPSDVKAKRTSTMPVPPSPKKSKERPTPNKINSFFHRPLKGTRRNSSVSFPQRPASPEQTKSQPKRVDTGSGSSGATLVDDRHHDVARPVKSAPAADDADDVPRTDSRAARAPGVQFALPDPPPPVDRRPSSQTRRRASIFTRTGEHVDAGVGSKARRLSVAFPDEFQVDECPLEDHFSLIARMKKKHIGEGGAATVQLMSSKTASDGKTRDKVFAVKEFRQWEEGDESQAEYERKIKSEFAIAKSLEHPNIVETYQLCYMEKRTKWYHVMEFCDHGDLNDIIRESNFSLEDRHCMFKQLMRGVEYLHSRGIAHRDLKSENLLLDKTGCLKIADFGTSEVFSGTHPGLQRCRRPSIIAADAEIKFCEPGLVGSRPYMAPELLEHRHPYDPRAIDVWSCGIVYISLILRSTPWDAAIPDPERHKNYHIYASSWERFRAAHPDLARGPVDPDGPFPDMARSRQWAVLPKGEMLRLLFGMLNPDPQARVSAKEAVGSKAVALMECCQQEGYSGDIKTRERKVMHRHLPPAKKVKGGVLGGVKS